jgi:chromate transporter
MATELKRLTELAQVFLKLGILGFGGPAVHIAMMEEEVVTRRQWLTRSQFLDLLGATNLIPGPNSTEMAIHLGYSYGGLLGLGVAGTCFILPAVLVTTVFAWFYLIWGNLPALGPILTGIKPAILIVILAALWRLGQKAFKDRKLIWIALFVIVLVLIGTPEAIALFGGGILGMIWIISQQAKFPSQGTFSILLLTVGITSKTAVISPTLLKLGLFFLKVGSILFTNLVKF